MTLDGVLMRARVRLPLGALLAAVPIFAITSPAYGDAVGYTTIGGFEYTFEGAEVSIPTGSFITHRSRGKGLFRDVRGTRTIPVHGKSCAIFYVNGAARAKQCHYIVKS
jgi:hypothetical protein